MKRKISIISVLLLSCLTGCNSTKKILDIEMEKGTELTSQEALTLLKKVNLCNEKYLTSKSANAIIDVDTTPHFGEGFGEQINGEENVLMEFLYDVNSKNYSETYSINNNYSIKRRDSTNNYTSKFEYVMLGEYGYDYENQRDYYDVYFDKILVEENYEDPDLSSSIDRFLLDYDFLYDVLKDYKNTKLTPEEANWWFQIDKWAIFNSRYVEDSDWRGIFATFEEFFEEYFINYDEEAIFINTGESINMYYREVYSESEVINDELITYTYVTTEEMVFVPTNLNEYKIASRNLKISLLSNGDVDGNKYDDLEEYGTINYTYFYNYNI